MRKCELDGDELTAFEGLVGANKKPPLGNVTRDSRKKLMIAIERNFDCE